ncbi:unnamed protein product [Prorocentrum cordatum]|uniref:Uncharacterized protein n=1 Tax=Prorocentrum cordatum TaxID=2364126 RepID=A0ABN9WYF6_9DINO|nr:unnamed protein product [Polarella glacialis]
MAFGVEPAFVGVPTAVRRGLASPGGHELQHSSSLPLLSSLGRGLGSPLGGGQSSPGARSAIGLHRHKSGGLLCGVSKSAETFNTQSQQNLHRLLGGSRGEEDPLRLTAPGKEGKRRSDDLGKAEASDEDFADMLDGALGSIAALRRNMDNFDPKGGGEPRSGPASPARARGRAGGAGLSREDSKKLRERIESYKMVRRLEPELPPLQQSPPKPPREPSQADILLRNASPEALRRQSLESRKLKMHQHVQLEDLRAELAASARSATVDAKARGILVRLEQKSEQGARAAAMRRNNQPKHQDTKDLRKEQMVEKWLAACFAGVFARQVLEELRVRRMSDKERLEYVARTEQLRRVRGHNASPFVQSVARQTHSIQEMHRRPDIVRRLGDAATRLQYLLRRNRRRQEARCVVACLTEWRVGGRTFVALKQFAQRVVKMQQWWRRARARLREARDRISKHWERLEREQVGRELNKAAPLPATSPAGRRNRPPSDQRAPLEERVKAAMTPEEVRNRFLEHELRARRYALLPAILCWEEDVAQWRTNWLRWMEEREAHCALGLEGTVVVPMPVTTWPPVRPSHLPCAHLPQEVTRNCECPHWCPGRKGDEEILDMLRRCRASPGMHSGWTKVGVGQPRRGSGSSSRASGGAVQRDSNGCAEEFAVDSEPVEEEELRQWGCNADRLPGASKGPPARPSKDQ